jgi:phage I-like protein
MTTHVGYLVDLASVKLDESGDVTSSWIQAMTVGKYQHPVHGEINITPERIAAFADNVNKGVRGTDLDIDYDHKAVTQEAAGWVKKAEARVDGLWIFVEWTKAAAEKIRSKAYRYFSPEFVDEWQHPKLGQTFKDVLFGGGITNRPFLKDILPINLSEAFAPDAQVATNQGGQMDPKKLRELLGLPEDATDEQVSTALTEKLSAKPNDDNKDGKAGDVNQLSEEVVRLAEQNPAVKALTDQVAAQQKQLAEVAVALRLAEVATTVTKLSDTAKAESRAFPPAVTEQLSVVLAKAPKELSDDIVKLFTDFGKTGFVQLGEQGGAGQSTPDGDAVKVFADATKKYQDEHEGVSYADAVQAVAAEQPKLFDDYQQSAYAFRI